MLAPRPVWLGKAQETDPATRTQLATWLTNTPSTQSERPGIGSPGLFAFGRTLQQETCG